MSIPIKILQEAEGFIVSVELSNGDIYRGTLDKAQDNMNLTLRDVTYATPDGQITNMLTVFIRGSQINFVSVPDMLRNSPFLVRDANEDLKGTRRGLIDAKVYGKGSGSGKKTQK